jgi:aminopeptidase 2
MSSATFTKPLDEYRLPLDVKPTHYDVTIRTDLDKLSFGGFAKIDLDIKKETSTIVFNTMDLNLSDASIYSLASKTQQVQVAQTIDGTMGRATVHFRTPLPAGSKAQLQIGFKGNLTSSMQGYYKSGWEHEGKTKYYALTQFEPTAARRAFPCWDEPLLKATFAITLISRADTVNLSNMPVVSEKEYTPESKEDPGNAVSPMTQWFSFLTQDTKPTDKWKITQFETTPPMSSYIVAFANGHFEHLESSYTSPLSGKTRPLRIYTTSDGIGQAQFALDIKAKVLPLYEKVFDIEYPLPKLDTLVAHDFDAGAMENWGLITGRTSAFLLDPKRVDMAAKKRVVTTQSHEVAHMWFGNITTMEWWDYLYLNEGFATLMGEVIIADKIFPDWKLDAQFISEHLNDALRLDAKLSSHPIEVDCPDADKIDQIFDALSYSKAASVLRMLSDYVGEERFLKGVSLYLKKRLYGNSVTKDLWEGIGEATGIAIPKIMEDWITKIGFPVLTVTENENGIHIRQDRFLETGPAEAKENETIWTIPLSLLSINGSGKPSIDKLAVLESREKTIAIDTGKPFKLNAGTTGVYRVLYSPERLASIATEAAKGDAVFSLKDRIGLVHDAYALARAGFSKVSSALTLVDTLKDEKEFLVWDSVSENLETLVSTWWEQPGVTDPLNGFRRALYAPLIKRLGYEYSESDSADTTLLRTRAIHHAALAKDQEVLKELKNRFDHFMQTGDNSKIPADLQRITFISAVKYGGREEYDAMRKICDKPPNPSAGISAMLAIGAAQDLSLIDETLDYITTKVRDQDVVNVFSGLSGNFKTRRILVEFFKKNYDVLQKRFEGNFMMRYLIQRTFGGLSTEKDYEDIVEFFKDKNTAKYNMALAQTLDTIRAKIAWIERSTADIEEWLGKREREG